MDWVATNASKSANRSGQSGTLQQIAANLPIGFANGVERIRHADGAAGNRYGDIEELDIYGFAETGRCSHLPVQSRNKFWAGGVVLHLIGRGLGVGEDLAAGVDHGNARAGSNCSLAGDLIQRCGRAVFDARGEHQRLLPQRRLDLAAQHALPGTSDEQIERERARRDDHQGREKQLQEDATLHGLQLFKVSEFRSGSPLREPSSDNEARPGSPQFSHECGARRHPPIAA